MSTAVCEHKIVSNEKWTKRRAAFLAKEKELTRLRNEVSQKNVENASVFGPREGKNIGGAMRAGCCIFPRKDGKMRRLFGVGGSIGPGAMLLLLPKCPACIAAYLAVWTGAGLAAPVAEYLRPMLAVAFGASVIYLVGGRFTGRRRRLSAA